MVQPYDSSLEHTSSNMADTAIYHFTEDQRSHPVRHDEGAVCPNVQSFAVWVDKGRVYGSSAVCFGQVSCVSV